MAKSIDIFEKYCTGCGLCGAVNSVNFKKDSKGFLVPYLSEDDLSFCQRFCPASGQESERYLNGSHIWGRIEESYVGFSKDAEIRKAASSGGMITELCTILLETKKVDGIIHSVANQKNPWSTETTVSRSKSELQISCGSRYASSNPLMGISEYFDDEYTYAFVGKPCDVAALRLYMDANQALNQKFLYLISFFCAGVPSEAANLDLLNHLSCAPEKCISLRYRGDGWPGFTKAVDSDGKESSMSYSQSWGKILGRDIRTACRYCIDGIGELADIACADLWYLNDDMTPNFDEHKGRNVVFARTNRGKVLMEEISAKGAVEINSFTDIDSLKHVQYAQYNRRGTMHAQLAALRILRKGIPFYSRSVLKGYSNHVDPKLNRDYFFGTLKRCIKNVV